MEKIIKTDFTQLYLKQFDLLQELNDLLSSNKVHWHKNQICFTTINDPTKINDYTFGCGSLYTHFNPDGSTTKKTKIYNESEFTVFVDTFNQTLFKDIYNYINSKYRIGRMRLIRSLPHTCLSWHYDDTTRLHYVLKTNEKCKMVIEDKCFHMPKDTWWEVDTTKYHTAFNGSLEERIHLVCCILQK